MLESRINVQDWLRLQAGQRSGWCWLLKLRPGFYLVIFLGDRSTDELADCCADQQEIS